MGSSVAEYNHKAFTFFESQGLLALPFQAWINSEDYYGVQFSLELFQVEVENGFTYLGAIDGNALLSDMEQSGELYCDYYYSAPVERGIFMDDVLYAVGTRGLIAAETTSLDEPIGVLHFDDPSQAPTDCYYYEDEWGVGVGGGEVGAPGDPASGGVGGTASSGSSGGEEADGAETGGASSDSGQGGAGAA
jgi:hypothetical protein